VCVLLGGGGGALAWEHHLSVPAGRCLFAGTLEGLHCRMPCPARMPSPARNAGLGRVLRPPRPTQRAPQLPLSSAPRAPQRPLGTPPAPPGSRCQTWCCCGRGPWPSRHPATVRTCSSKQHADGVTRACTSAAGIWGAPQDAGPSSSYRKQYRARQPDDMPP
jgi:hypothetical protein